MNSTQFRNQNPGSARAPIQILVLIQFLVLILVLVQILLLAPTLQAQSHPPHQHHHPSYATPPTFPYLDSTQGRASYRYASAPQNESRLYDFYRRQADHHRGQSEPPPLLPAFPGLDGGAFGHWGKNSNMGHVEDRWSRLQLGPALASILRLEERAVPKALILRLPGPGDLSLAFDTEALHYAALWTGGHLQHSATRWGLMGSPKPAGDIIAHTAPAAPSPPHSRFAGYYLHGDRVVLDYRLEGQRILELPSASKNAFHRSIEFPDGATALSLPILSHPTDRVFFNSSQTIAQLDPAPDGPTQPNPSVTRVELHAAPPTQARLAAKDGHLFIDLAHGAPDAVLTLSLHFSSPSSLNPQPSTLPPAPSTLNPQPSTLNPYPSTPNTSSPSPPRWPLDTPPRGTHGSSPDAYAIDTLGVPLGNPYLSPMFLTGLAFFANGDAAIATFFGDVWIVSGIDRQLRNLRWKRFATGLHHPLGLEIVDDTVHVVGRDQITALRDLNGNGEADFYETMYNDFPTHTGSHDFNTGLQADADGNLYFASAENGVVQVSPERDQARSLADGIRNPNGIGVAPDGRVLTSAQEGEWAPASMIVQASRGGSYGWSFEDSAAPPAAPLVYLPRGIDPSSGGQAYVSSAQWGPASKTFVGLSYGNCSHYLILQSQDGHGAVAPLAGEFLSGVHRARFHPIDGQLYTVGTQGWGTYAQYDGSFERVRYTGKPVSYPTGFRVFKNGIRLDFDRDLSELPDLSRLDNYFCQQWNYRYSPGYGSPEYSTRQPGTIGHDPAPLRSVRLLPDQRSLFLEIPELQAAMQTHLRYAIPSPEGDALEGELFLTALELDEAFRDAEGLLPVSPSAKRLDLRRQVARAAPRPQPADPDDPGRLLELAALPGLVYDRESLSVAAGERLTLRLVNRDAMPHNWILGDSGSYTRLGQIADARASDPSFGDAGYIPDHPDVLAAIATVAPHASAETTFTAPAVPGTYPFLCTFPGHWKIMKGTLIVYPGDPGSARDR